MPDLKKLITLEALQAALPSWLKSSSKPSYTADEISDTNTTNKFVTSTEKNTWNAKGTYSKPQNGIPKSDLESDVQTSLGKADTALQSFTETDPTVPSWAKATNKPSYNSDEISDTNRTHKFATQSQLNQIGVNQTNILYSINTGVKNLVIIESFQSQRDGNISVSGNSITVSGATSWCKGWQKLHIIRGMTYKITFKVTANTSANACVNVDKQSDFTNHAYQLSIYSQGTGTYTGEFTAPSDSDYLYLSITSNNTSSTLSTATSITVTELMICPKSVYEQDSSYAPGSVQNSDLTQLEAEDRAALAEEIDAGAKNKWANGTSGTISGWRETFQIGQTLKKGTYIIYFDSLTSTDTDATTCQIIAINGSTQVSNIAQCNRGSKVYTTLEISSDATAIWIYSSHSSGTGKGDTATFTNGMICTKAAFAVSQKFVPYRMPYSQSLTLLNQKAPSGIADYVASGSADDLPSGCALCNSNVTGMPALSDHYFIIRTRIYDANCAEQEAIAPAGNRRFNRTKWGGTWTSWAEYTKS